MNKMPKSSVRGAVIKSRKSIMGGRRTGTPRFSELPRDGLLRAAERHDVDGDVVVAVAAGMDDDNAKTGRITVRA